MQGDLTVAVATTPLLDEQFESGTESWFTSSTDRALFKIKYGLWNAHSLQGY